MTHPRIAIGLCGFPTLTVARGGPPFVTDDPEPPPTGSWEINVPVTLERTGRQTEMDAPLFDVNYGLANVQLKLEITERLTLAVEVFANTSKEKDARADLAFNLGGAWKLSPHLNLLFSAGHSIVGDTEAMSYIWLQALTKE